MAYLFKLTYSMPPNVDTSMYIAKTFTYCMTCKKQKHSFKGCAINHHSLVVYDPDYSYGIEDEDSEIRLLIFRKRWIDIDETPIVRPKAFKSNCCPVHGERALGYCITCGRLVCFEEYAHFDHEMLLFVEHAVEWEKEISDDDILLYEELSNEIEGLEAWIDNRNELLDQNVKLQETVMRELGTHIANDSVLFLPHLVSALHTIASWKRSDGENDMDKISEELKSLKDERERLIVKESLLKYRDNWLSGKKSSKPDSWRMRRLDEVKGAYRTPEFAFDIYKRGMTHCNGIIRKDGLVLPLSLRRYGYDVIVVTLIPSTTLKVERIDRAARVDNHRAGVPTKIRLLYVFDHVPKYKSTNFNTLHNGVFYFIDTNDDIVKITFGYDWPDGTIVRSDEEVIESEYKFKRILTVFNSDVELMAVTVDGWVVYCKDGWHKLMYLPYDKIRYYVGTSNRDNAPIEVNMKRGALFSRSMAYRVCRPSVRCHLNALIYDSNLGVCIQRGIHYYSLSYAFQV